MFSSVCLLSGGSVARDISSVSADGFIIIDARSEYNHYISSWRYLFVDALIVDIRGAASALLYLAVSSLPCHF